MAKANRTPHLIHAGVEHECDECLGPIAKGHECVSRYTSGGGGTLSEAGLEYFHLGCWDEKRAWLFSDLTVEKMRALAAQGGK